MKKLFLISILSLAFTAISFAQLKVISNGNVGIGTTTPNNLLQVANLINFDNTSNIDNTFLGYYSGTNSTGADNTATGFNSLYSNTTGYSNTASGYNAGYYNTTGYENVFSGYLSGNANISGHDNVFMGNQSGKANTTANFNTFLGALNGTSTTTGNYNSFLGYGAGSNNITGSQNTFIGLDAGLNNTASDNTYIGCWAGFTGTSGNYNTFTGWKSGYLNLTGYDNTFNGAFACYNSTGKYNTAIGYYAGYTITTGDSNTFVGYIANAGGDYHNCAAFGYGATASASDKIKIGNNYIIEIGGQVGWHTYSDGRFKFNVNENVKGLEFIKKLRPVTYQMNTQQLDAFITQNIPQPTDSLGNSITTPAGDYSKSMAIVHSGFIAQEVEQAENEIGFKSSIVSKPSNSNDPYSLSYAEIVVPLVKAVQELNKTNDSLKTLQKTTDSLLTDMQKQLSITTNNLQQQISNCCNIVPSNTDKSTTINSGGTGENNSTEKLNGKTTPALYQNIPNPFKEKTSIRYYLPSESTAASMLIFDMQGKLIKTYNINTTGDGNIEINGGEMQPGMYMYSLIVNGKEIDTKRMILTN